MSMLLDKLQQAGPFAVAAMGGGPAAELFAAVVAQLQRVVGRLFLTLIILIFHPDFLGFFDIFKLESSFLNKSFSNSCAEVVFLQI